MQPIDISFLYIQDIQIADSKSDLNSENVSSTPLSFIQMVLFPDTMTVFSKGVVYHFALYLARISENVNTSRFTLNLDCVSKNYFCPLSLIFLNPGFHYRILIKSTLFSCGIFATLFGNSPRKKYYFIARQQKIYYFVTHAIFINGKKNHNI